MGGMSDCEYSFNEKRQNADSFTFSAGMDPVAGVMYLRAVGCLSSV